LWGLLGLDPSPGGSPLTATLPPRTDTENTAPKETTEALWATALNAPAPVNPVAGRVPGRSHAGVSRKDTDAATARGLYPNAAR